MGRNIAGACEHRPELVASEYTAVLADTHLLEDRRPPAFKPDGNNDNQEDWPEQEKEKCTSRNIKHALRLE